MDLGAEPQHWLTVDNWWNSYPEVCSSAFPTSTVTLDPHWMEDTYVDIDAWWEPYVDLAGFLDDHPRIGCDAMEDDWMSIEPLWDAYIEARADDVAELNRALSKSNVLWRQQEGSFDADPLSVNHTQAMRSGDPLNPDVEEDWSDWLAQLLRTDIGELHHELFGGEFTAPPRQVEREAHLPNLGSIDRYADILSKHSSEGISIEIKIGDTNFKKTIDTTNLIENQRYGEWRHYLLVPEDDLRAVHNSFDNELIDDEERQREVIHSERSRDIELLYWSDVSRALRAILLDETRQSPHWVASAYLLCAQIEQEILEFTSQTTVEQLRAEGNRARSFESVSVVIDNLETQVEYLNTFTNNTNE